MTRMTMPTSRAASTMRLPSARKASGLGYCSMGMSLGRMKGLVLIACYRLLWTAREGSGRASRRSTLSEDVVLHLLFVEHDDDTLEDAFGVLAAGVDHERATGLLGAARLVDVAVKTQQ